MFIFFVDFWFGLLVEDERCVICGGINYDECIGEDS